MCLHHLGDLMFHQKTLHERWCMSGHTVVTKLPITGCPYLWPSESSEQFLWRNVQASGKIWCRFIALLTQSFWMWWPHSTHAHSIAVSPSSQWICHCSHMCITVYSPWLAGYMDVKQTILIILTTAGLYPDRHCLIHTHTHTYKIHIHGHAYLCVCV